MLFPSRHFRGNNNNKSVRVRMRAGRERADNVMLLALAVFPLNFKLSQMIFTCLLILRAPPACVSVKEDKAGDYFPASLRSRKNIQPYRRHKLRSRLEKVMTNGCEGSRCIPGRNCTKQSEPLIKTSRNTPGGVNLLPPAAAPVI